MKHVSIALSAEHETFVDEQIASGRYASVGEFLAELIDAKAKADAQERLETLLLDGLTSPSRPWTPDSMDEIRRTAHARL